MGTPDIAHNGNFDPSFENATGTRRPLDPDDDPFYEPPPGFAGAEVGTVLRVRSVTTALFGLIPQRFPAWQLLYRTSDLHGRPAAAVTTVLLPAGWDSARSDGSARTDAANSGSPAPRALLSFQSAIDAVSSRCFPSYALRRGARAAGSVPQFEFLFIAT
ncbi:MAG: hypothetical protein L0H59_01235, partial [Tomitella sp.]|nr:hypothetical protein [Tomitella sp.]